MFTLSDKRSIGILETFNSTENYAEFRVAPLDSYQDYLLKDVSVPLTQAKFVLAFNKAPVFLDYVKAHEYACALMPEYGLHHRLHTIAPINQSKHDYNMFMCSQFAFRLVDRSVLKSSGVL